MFTAGQPLPEDPEETREYDAVAVAADEEAVEAIEDEEFVEEAEDETWEGDEYKEWEEEAEKGGEMTGGTAGKAEQDEGEASRSDDLKVWFAEFRARARVLWADALKRIGDIRLPRQEIDGQKVLAVAGVIAIALLVGAGGYLLGKGTGDDLDTARLEGEFTGKRAGAIAGAAKGYAAGFRKGRDLAFRESYSASYRRNYRRAYENAGMDPPRAEDIEVPKP